MAGHNWQSTFIRVTLIADIVIGWAALIASLWTGKGVSILNGRGFYLIDRVGYPILYWGWLIAILLGLVAYPLWCLYRPKA
jgi:hypothetical protein